MGAVALWAQPNTLVKSSARLPATFTIADKQRRRDRAVKAFAVGLTAAWCGELCIGLEAGQSLSATSTRVWRVLSFGRWNNLPRAARNEN